MHSVPELPAAAAYSDSFNPGVTGGPACNMAAHDRAMAALYSQIGARLMTIAEEIMNYHARRQVYMPRINQRADIDRLDNAVDLLLCKVRDAFVGVADVRATYHLGRQPTVAELEAYMDSMWSSRKAWDSAAGPGGRERMAGGSVPAGDTLTPVDPTEHERGDGVDSERGAEAAAAGIMEVVDAGREGSTRGAAAAGIMEVDDAGREGSARGLREAAAAGIVEVDDAGQGGSALQECPRTPPLEGPARRVPDGPKEAPKGQKAGCPRAVASRGRQPECPPPRPPLAVSTQRDQYGVAALPSGRGRGRLGTSHGPPTLITATGHPRPPIAQGGGAAPAAAAAPGRGSRRSSDPRPRPHGPGDRTQSRLNAGLEGASGSERGTHMAATFLIPAGDLGAHLRVRRPRGHDKRPGLQS